jgi:hypothetical protein
MDRRHISVQIVGYDLIQAGTGALATAALGRFCAVY